MVPRGHDPPRGNHGHPLHGDNLTRLPYDLYALLTVISGLTQLLQRDLDRGQLSGTPKLPDRLARIERAAKAMEARLRRLEDHRR